MPLARILTHHPERATALAEQLQQQGYRVEVCRPDQPNLSGADLEIEFEICERADALERAASLADELHADVAVAPGVLQAQAQPEIAEVAAPPSAEPITDRELTDREREFQAAFQTAEPEIEPAAARADLSKADLSEADLAEKEQPQVIDFPVMEQSPLYSSKPEPSLPGTPEPLPPVQFIDESPSGNEPLVAVETPRAADPVPYLAQLTPFGTPGEQRAERFSNREPEQQPVARKRAGAGLGKRASQFVGRSIAAMKVGAAETAESFRENLKEYKKRAQVRSAEAHAARVARMLDLEQRQAEAQERAKELGIAREAAAARLADLLRERDPGLREEGMRQEQLREEMLYEASKPSAPSRDKSSRASAPLAARPVDATPLRKPAGSLGHPSSGHASLGQTWIAGLIARPRRPMSPQLRAVLTGAAAVTFLFVIGIALGVLQPHAPLASTGSKATSSSGASAAGGGVTLQTGGVTVKTGTPAQSTPAKPLQSPATSAKTQGAEQVKPSPRVSTAKHIAEQNGEKEIGDDVVVRHFNTPAPTQKPKQNGQQAGLKHFSDLDDQ
jgi:hypothetical protein